MNISTALRCPAVELFKQQLAAANARYKASRTESNRYQLVVAERRLAAALDLLLS